MTARDENLRVQHSALAFNVTWLVSNMTEGSQAVLAISLTFLLICSVTSVKIMIIIPKLMLNHKEFLGGDDVHKDSYRA